MAEHAHWLPVTPIRTVDIKQIYVLREICCSGFILIYRRLLPLPALSSPCVGGGPPPPDWVLCTAWLVAGWLLPIDGSTEAVAMKRKRASHVRRERKGILLWYTIHVGDRGGGHLEDSRGSDGGSVGLVGGRGSERSLSLMYQ